MALKKYNPTTPGRRQMTGYTFEELTTSKPFKALTHSLWRNHAWRNNTGRITTRHQWGGHKKSYRIIDFHYVDKLDIPAKIETIEYDPYRTSYIALVCYRDWERRYVTAHKDMKVWDEMITSKNAKLISWNRLEIWNIPVGLSIYNVEIIVWKGASSVRSAGSSATILSQEWEYTQVKMPSGEIRLVHKLCYATLGVVSNTDHNQVVIGKAGRSRWKWIRPTVLGKSMNPVDHPHGGWEWHSPIGMPYPKTPWGKPALGVKTRKRKDTNKWVLRKRDWRLMKK
ncbi:MAG: hypothetical protein ACD_49C00038G0014 [uncultured bacterium (gcode 4)]|uniref:Large ribosomal subunit protein uL2 n=1 Tax=uncultured bacterium (gcode 4) TaxID=1234023 RepID=K2AEK2_9BACT|nr:MAG: hypothetical protein ACD_49C00038G0014 [uncultured bacterium (gcode 4)]